MKTYLQELRGQVRGNARLKRRIESKNRQLDMLAAHIAVLVTMLDKLGHGADAAVVLAASAIGWKRFDAAMREQILKDIHRGFGVTP